MHLFNRMEEAKRNLTPFYSDYRVVFDADIDGISSIMVPDPNWMAMALEGGYVPKIEAYISDQKRMKDWMLANPQVPFSWSKVGGALHPYADTADAMTEEDAIEYLIQKDVPNYEKLVAKDNSLKLVICKKDQLPDTRKWRGAWQINQDLTLEEEAV